MGVTLVKEPSTEPGLWLASCTSEFCSLCKFLPFTVLTFTNPEFVSPQPPSPQGHKEHPQGQRFPLMPPFSLPWVCPDHSFCTHLFEH